MNKKIALDKQQPLVSVIMTAFATKQEYFQESVESILIQSYKNFEFLLVDDGLTEKNREYLKSINDQRLKVLVNESNIGQSRSVNRALAKAQGKYVVRMDADDVATSTRLEEQVSFMEEHSELIAAGAQVQYLGGNKIRPRKLTEDEIRTWLLFRNVLIHPTMILRRDLLNKNNIKYDPDLLYAQDYMLWIDLCESGNVALQEKVVLFYRIHENQITNKKQQTQARFANYARLKYLKRYRSTFTYDESELIGEIANMSLAVHWSRYNDVVGLLLDAETAGCQNFNYQVIKKVLYLNIIKSVLHILWKSHCFSYLGWSYFWKALLHVPYWSYYFRNLF